MVGSNTILTVATSTPKRLKPRNWTMSTAFTYRRYATLKPSLEKGASLASRAC